MNRRTVTLALASAALVRTAAATESGQVPKEAGGPTRLKIAMLIHPDMVFLDLIGPQTVFSLAMAEVHLVWKDRQPVSTDVGVPIAATTSFSDCPHNLDALFVPGGLKGSIALMEDENVLAFLADRGKDARYVTSVCTGSLVLGAAGLLKGYRATSHWYVRDYLPLMGAIVEPGRVVVDRNRVTRGGVTAGLDFGLTLVAELRGKDLAKRIQLVLEYDPKPPFDAGAPDRATDLADEVRRTRAPLLAAARETAIRAGARQAL